MTTPYYQDEHVTLHHSLDGRELTEPCPLCPFRGCPTCQHQGGTDRPRKEP